MTAPTLAQLAKVLTDPLRKGILMNLLRDSEIIGLVPWEASDSLTVKQVRWKSLPTTPAFRSLNEGYSNGYGETEQVEEALYGFGFDIQFDRVMEKIGNTIVPMRTLLIEQHVKAKSLIWNDYFINGDHATDAKAFEGLKKRVAAMPTRQTVYAAASNAAALDPTASVANARAFIDAFEEGLYKCAGGNAQACFVNEGIKWGFAKVLRYAQASGGALLDTTKDSFDRTVVSYKGVPIVDVGLKVDQSTEIITNTETAGDSGSDATSAYFVHFGSDEHGLTGVQLEAPAIYDPLAGGESATTPTKMLRFDWWVGLVNMGSYGITRVCNFEGANGWT